MAKKHDWKKVGEIIAKVRELGGAQATRMGDEIRRQANGALRLQPEGQPRSREASVPATDGPGKAKRPRRQQRVRSRCPAMLGDLIRGYRRDHSTHGFKRIEDLLKQKHLVIVTRKQIRKELKGRACWTHAIWRASTGWKGLPKGTRRFERPIRARSGRWT